jgi:hypothetical protein
MAEPFVIDMSDPARLVGNYAFCMMYQLFRRRYDRAVVGRTNKVPIKRFIGVAAGVASPLLLALQALGGQRRDRSRRRDRHHRRQPQRPLGHHPRLVHLLT